MIIINYLVNNTLLIIMHNLDYHEHKTQSHSNLTLEINTGLVWQQLQRPLLRKINEFFLNLNKTTHWYENLPNKLKN